jgi:hypothetical protein
MILGQSQNLFSFVPIFFDTGADLFPNTDNLETRTFRIGKQIPFLSFTGLIGRRYPTVNCGPLSQLNPPATDA